MRPLLALCLVALAVAGSASASNPVRVTMITSSTKPFVGEPWRYTIAVEGETRKPLAARVRLQILRGQAVVGCRKRKAVVACSGRAPGTWIRFTRRHTATIVWPARLKGVRLTFQATVRARGHTLRLRAPVTPRLPSRT